MSQLVACPECKKHLQVPDDLLGKKVQCPECKHTFVAKTQDEEVNPSKTSTTAAPPPSKPAAWDKKTKADDDENEDRPSKPIKKRPRDDDEDDDEDDDDRPRRRRRRSSSRRGGHFVAHRGGMILAFGLISLITGFVVLGILAWIFGNADMKEMQAGRMDPDGEGMTQAGRIMGMISVILWVVAMLGVCAYFVFVFIIVAALIGGGAAVRPGPPPRRRF